MISPTDSTQEQRGNMMTNEETLALCKAGINGWQTAFNNQDAAGMRGAIHARLCNGSEADRYFYRA